MPTLHWLTREQDIGAAGRVPYRLLEEAPDLSAGDHVSLQMLFGKKERLARIGQRSAPRMIIFSSMPEKVTSIGKAS
jgi:hypothetical protein